MKLASVVEPYRAPVGTHDYFCGEFPSLLDWAEKSRLFGPEHRVRLRSSLYGHWC